MQNTLKTCYSSNANGSITNSLTFSDHYSSYDNLSEKIIHIKINQPQNNWRSQVTIFDKRKQTILINQKFLTHKPFKTYFPTCERNDAVLPLGADQVPQVNHGDNVAPALLKRLSLSGFECLNNFAPLNISCLEKTSHFKNSAYILIITTFLN